MTSLLFDTNALIYSVCVESEHYEDVHRLLRTAITSDNSIYILASSLNEVYYVLQRHYMTEADARSAIRNIANTFSLIDLTGIFAAAEALQVDAIISYDKAAFKQSPIPKMTAPEALSTFF